MDYLNINDTFIPSLHTDLDFNYFESNGINIWVLEENTESYGNMFLLESTKLDNIDNSILISLKNDKINVYSYDAESTFLNMENNEYFKITNIDLKDIKIKYLNIQNNECLVMNKNLPHSSDIRRNKNQIKAFNFRILLKEEDGSIIFKNLQNIKLHPNKDHKLIGNRMYNIKMFDFI